MAKRGIVKNLADIHTVKNLFKYHNPDHVQVFKSPWAEKNAHEEITRKYPGKALNFHKR